jgi:Fe-S-cluster containining protein
MAARPDAIISVKELLRRVRTRTFDYSAGLRSHAEKKLGQPVTCAKGCSFCCSSKLMVDQGTGAVIAMYLEAEGRWTPRLVDELRATDAEMTATNHHDWFEKRRSCVFLDKGDAWGSGTCTVHAVRPFACLATFSVNDPQLCSVGTNSSAFQIADENLTENLMPYHEALLRTLGETETFLMTLPGAVLYGHDLITKVRPLAPGVLRLRKANVPSGDRFVPWLDEHGAAHAARMAHLFGAAGPPR